MGTNEKSLQQEIDKERETLLEQIHAWLEIPMLALAFIWLALFVVEVIWGLTPILETAGYAIWLVFIVEYVLGFTLAPRKREYLKRNWLKSIALLAPAMRIFRIASLVRLARLSRVARGLRLLRVLSSLNRGMRALGTSMGRRGFGYVAVLTVIVIVVGAAGMYAFERSVAGGGEGLANYGAALWWTAMLVTTLGSDYWPQTAEGRVLCFILSLYGIAVFGYITAALATFFIGRDAEHDDAEVAGARSIAALRSEIAALREEIRTINK